MKILETILLVVDDHAPSDDIVKMASQVANRTRSKIILLSVVPTAKQETRAMDELKTVARQLNKTGVGQTECQVCTGTPYDAIIRVAALCDANVIMVSSQQKHEPVHHGLSVTAGRLLRESIKPVWLHKNKSSKNIEIILCPIDFSAASERALHNAIHLTRTFSAELIVIHVSEPHTGLSKGSGMANPYLEDHHLDAIDSVFDKFLSKFDLHDVEWRKALRQGSPHNEILALADHTKCDLLVMGTVGHSRLWRILIGSVAERVIRKTPCSVIALRAENAIRVHLDQVMENLEDKYKQANELLEQGFAQEALGLYQLTVGENPLFAPGWMGMAKAHERLGHADESRECHAKSEDVHAWMTGQGQQPL